MNISKKFKIHDYKGQTKNDMEQLFLDIRRILGPLSKTPDVFISHGKLAPVTPNPFTIKDINAIDSTTAYNIERFANIISQELFPANIKNKFIDYE